MQMNSMLDRKLGFVLRLLRINAELSQRDVAGASGVSQPTVSRWEHGESVPDRAQCTVLCRLLDIEGRLAAGQVASVNTGLGPYTAGSGCPAEVVAAEIAE